MIWHDMTGLFLEVNESLDCFCSGCFHHQMKNNSGVFLMSQDEVWESGMLRDEEEQKRFQSPRGEAGPRRPVTARRIRRNLISYTLTMETAVLIIHF